MGTRKGIGNRFKMTDEERRERQKAYKEVTMKSLHKEYTVEAKCPRCCTMHTVIMTQMPFILPRVYCEACKGCRTADELVTYNMKIFWGVEHATDREGCNAQEADSVGTGDGSRYGRCCGVLRVPRLVCGVSAMTIRDVLLYLFMVLIAWFAAYGFFTLAFKVYDYLDRPSHVASAWIKERHKYHGIQVSEIYRGEHTFMRDGKRCRL
jgi:hypothetical protein